MLKKLTVVLFASFAVFALMADTNLVKPFEAMRTSESFWRYNRKLEKAGILKFSQGIIAITSSAKDKVIINSLFLAVPADKSKKSLTLSVEFKGSGKPKGYEYGIVLDITYLDNSKEKWIARKTFLKFPTSVKDWKKFKISFTPPKQIKSVCIKLLFKGEAVIELRNPILKFTEPLKKNNKIGFSSSSVIQKIPGNLIPNSTFAGFTRSSGAPKWSIGASDRECMSVDNGIITFRIPKNHGFKIHGATINLNQTRPVALRYGLKFRGACYPIRYFHGILLDKVVYADGTAEGWAQTHFIFRAKSANWSNETTTWLPPKPVKSLRIYMLFTGSADAEFQIKDMFLKEEPKAFRTSNYRENFHGGPTNLVSNNGFEIVKAGEPKNWIACYKDHPANASLRRNIDYKIDDKVKRSGDYSLCLSNSKDSIAGVENFIYSIIDNTKEFTFSGWVKTEKATGLTFLEAVFFRAWAPIGVGSRAGQDLNRVNNIADFAGFWRTPITGGSHDWTKLEVSGKVPAGANLVRFRIWSIDNAGKVWIDDLEFDGLGNAPLEFISSQLGYPGKGVKKAFVRSKLAEKSGTFLIKKDGRIVKEGKLHYKGKNEWGRHDFECDFSELNENGNYSIEAEVGSHKVTSGTFLIKNDFYENLADSFRDFMFHMRCGYDIPGFHKACHLDDGQIRTKLKLNAGGKVIGHHKAWGGWHDAGDYDKFPAAAVLCIAELARLGKRFKSDKFSCEAFWGGDWLRRMATTEGVYYQVLRSLPNGKTLVDLCPPESETDNICGNADDRVIVGPGHDAMGPWALVECALAEQNPEKSRKYLDTALMLYQDFMRNKRPASKVYKELYLSFLIRTELGFFKLNRNEKYLTSAEAHLASLLDYVEKLNNSNGWKSIKMLHYYPFGMLISPAYYAMEFPSTELAVRSRKAVKNFIDKYAMPCLKKSPYRIVDPRKWPIAQYGQHHTLNNIGISSLLALASIVLDDPEYLEQAELNFYYITGNNPAGSSQISGYGRKVSTTWAACNTIPGHTNGTVISGGVLKGVARGKGKARCLAAYMHNGIYDYNIDHPAGFPYIMVAGNYPMAGANGCQEVWESMNGLALLAIDHILLAREHFSKK